MAKVINVKVRLKKFSYKNNEWKRKIIKFSYHLEPYQTYYINGTIRNAKNHPDVKKAINDGWWFDGDHSIEDTIK